MFYFFTKLKILNTKIYVHITFLLIQLTLLINKLSKEMRKNNMTNQETFIVTDTIKLGTVKLVDKNDIEELVDVIEAIEEPIIDNLRALGFELEDDMGEVEVTKEGATIATYNIYVSDNNAFVEVTLSNSPLSMQVITVLKSFAK